MKQYDIIVVGTGGANIVVDAAQKKGLKIAQIEKGKFGGTCLNRGCIPTKVMVTAANAVQEVEEFKKIGINVSEATMDWSTISKRVWHVIDENKDIFKYYDAFDNIDVYRGAASFVSDKVMKVHLNDGGESEELTAPIIILGTGGHSNIPNVPGLQEAGFLSSESLFGDKYPEKPYKSLAVLGAGPIGAEFSHVFASAGTEVTIIQHNVRLVPKEDEEVSAHLLENYRARGINVILNQDTVEIRQENGLKVVVTKDRTTGEITETKVEEILVAAGIRPTVQELHLENTGITTWKTGWIKTNEFLETSVDGIYALGDVNGEPAFRHRANYEADIIAHNLFYATSEEDYRWARYDTLPKVTFSYPEIGSVGLTEAEAVKAGYNVGVGKNYYSATAKGYAMGINPGDVNDGFVKIVVDKDTNYILGMHVVGPQASILFQPYVNLMNSGVTPLTAINEDIASERTKRLRAQGLTRNMDPRSVITVGETMSPHPSLIEVIMWTQVYYEHRW